MVKAANLYRSSSFLDEGFEQAHFSPQVQTLPYHPSKDSRSLQNLVGFLKGTGKAFS